MLTVRPSLPATTDQPENVERTSSGRLRPVCESCGRRGAPQPDSGGYVSTLDLPRGWSCAPYPLDYRHADGSTGTRYQCPGCTKATR